MRTCRRILSILGAAAPLPLCGCSGAHAQAAPRVDGVEVRVENGVVRVTAVPKPTP